MTRLPDADGHPSRMFRRRATVLRPAGPPPDATWYPWPFRTSFGAPGTVVSHCDAGPWNLAARDGAAEAVKAQVTPDSADPAPLWALAWRSRSAAWMIRHRALLENAVAG